MTGLTYDTGVLIAAERSDRRTWALHRAAIRRGIAPTVPSVVLAQGWRGGPQTQLSRLLRGCAIEDLDEATARAAGHLCGAAGTSDIVDASVVIAATRRSDAIMTSDPKDLARLVTTLGASTTVQGI